MTSIQRSPTARDPIADEREAHALKPKEKPFKRFFGNVCVRVTPASARYPNGTRAVYGRFWLTRGNSQKECRYPFGMLGTKGADGEIVTIAHCQRTLATIQADADHGTDPRVHRVARNEAVGYRFGTAASAWFEWRTTKISAHRNNQIRNSFDRYVLPRLAPRRLEAIASSEIIAVCKAIEDQGSATVAVETMRYIRGVFEYARSVDKFTGVNPVGSDAADHLENPEAVHHAAVQREDLPQFYADLAAHNWYDPLTPLGIRMCLHIMPRTTVQRNLRWEWINWDDRTIYVPENCPGLKQVTRTRRAFARAKPAAPKGPYRIPISKQLAALLREIETYREPGCPFLFPHRSENTICSSGTWYGAIKDMGWDGARDERHPNYRPNATVAGFRATFMSTLSQEYGPQSRKERPDWLRAAQRQLDHVDHDPVQAAYERDKLGGHRGLYIDQRHKIMQWWSNLLEAAEKHGTIKKPPNRIPRQTNGFRAVQKRRTRVEKVLTRVR